MSECPRILVHECPDAPEGHRFIAGFYRPAVKDGAVVGWSRLPVFFIAHDRDAVISKARDFWVAEQQRLARRDANRAATSARHRKAS